MIKTFGFKLRIRIEIRSTKPIHKVQLAKKKVILPSPIKYKPTYPVNKIGDNMLTIADPHHPESGKYGYKNNFIFYQATLKGDWVQGPHVHITPQRVLALARLIAHVPIIK